MIVGVGIFALGGLLYVANRLGISLGNLPGDIRIERNNFIFAFPLGTSILLSILITVGINIISQFIKK
ncbi:MAG: DUF2905 domain-containing protein [Chloroflexota bacterium]